MNHLMSNQSGCKGRLRWAGGVRPPTVAQVVVPDSRPLTDRRRSDEAAVSRASQRFWLLGTHRAVGVTYTEFLTLPVLSLGTPPAAPRTPFPASERLPRLRGRHSQLRNASRGAADVIPSLETPPAAPRTSFSASKRLPRLRGRRSQPRNASRGSAGRHSKPRNASRCSAGRHSQRRNGSRGSAGANSRPSAQAR